MKSSKTNKPRILLVGVGHFGINHLKDLMRLDKSGKIEFVGVMKNKTGEKVAQMRGVKVFSSLTDNLLKSVDAVDIVTPPSTHYQLAKKCLEFADVFLEKPITLSVDEGLELQKLSEKKKRVLFLGHIYRFHPSIVKLKEIIRTSSSGPCSIECSFGDLPKKITQDCGILYSDFHGFDIIDYLFGQLPKMIAARGVRRRRDSKFEDDVVVVLEYQSGLRGTVRMSWSMSPKVRNVMVYFQDRIIDVDLISQDILIEKDKKVEIKKGSGERPLMLELKYFVKVLKGEAIDYPDAVVGTRIVNIAAHAEKSLRSGHVISYKDIWKIQK